MSKKVLIDEELLRKVVIELNSSANQLRDCDEEEWAEEVDKLEEDIRAVLNKEEEE